jgi:uncharacterized protein YuzE
MSVDLTVTYLGGRPVVAYLYIPRRKREKSDHCREVEPSMVLDIDKQGKLIGIEFLIPKMVTLEAVNRVLEEYDLKPLKEYDLAPILAT